MNNQIKGRSTLRTFLKFCILLCNYDRKEVMGPNF